MTEQFLNNMNASQKKWFVNAIVAVAVLLAVFLAFKALFTMKEYSYIGDGVYPTNTITVSGTGEAFAIPDTGSFSYSVNETGKTVKEAQDKSSKKTNAILDALKEMGIDEKDIKTIGYNSNPQYEYVRASCISNPNDYSCGGKQVLVGYEVSQTISVKVRDTETAGDVLTKVGSLGASNISGLNFVTDDMDAIQAEARNLAIADAQEKAKALAKSLGVSLGKIVSYNEGYPMQPMYGYGTMAEMKVANQDSAMAMPPQLPVGQNEIVSNVSVTYEIR